MWKAWPLKKIVMEFEGSLKKPPPIAPGTPIRTHHRNDDSINSG
jgi:hypothetical protein